MIRWRYCLVMAMLLLLPTRIGSKIDEDDDEERRGEEGEEEDDDDEEDEEEETGGADKGGGEGGGGGDQNNPIMAQIPGRRAPPSAIPTQKVFTMTRTLKKRPLECYVCAYKSETPLRACLDPTKFRVHTMTCHSADDQCFTSVMSKAQSYEAVVRGCRSGCSSSSETTCCDINRCNNQAFAMPLVQTQVFASKLSNKLIPPNVLFFVTILLVLQTVVKVAFV